MEQFTYRYPHPAVTADCVVFGLDGNIPKVLLIERRDEPCKGMWAFPGGFMNIDETAEQCALRELKEETGLELRFVRQIGAFSEVHRDPRERVVTVAFYSLTEVSPVCGGDDAAQVRWWSLDTMPPLAFDHDTILRQAVRLLRQDCLADASQPDAPLPADDLRRLCNRYSAMPPSASPTKSKVATAGVNFHDCSRAPYSRRTTPDSIQTLGKNQIFVFGSNIDGRHHGGAARTAVERFGAIMGQGDGLQGQSYAISSMEGLDNMAAHVRDFIAFVRQHPELTFLVTRIGCGIAGYTVQEIAPLFAAAVAVENIWLPKDFWEELIRHQGENPS